jgi:hypothetical protein
VKSLTEELAPLGIANADAELQQEQSRLATGDNALDTGDPPNNNSKENAPMAATTNGISEQHTTPTQAESGKANPAPQRIENVFVIKVPAKDVAKNAAVATVTAGGIILGAWTVYAAGARLFTSD